MPGAAVSGPFLSSQLKTNLEFAIGQQPDYIALSFVTQAEDVLQVKEILKSKE